MPATARKRSRPVGTASTTRNRPLECAAGCDYRLRISRKCLAQGLPSCPCGALLIPVELDDALMYGPEDHPLALAYERELNRVAAGQAPQMASFRGAGSKMRSPHEVAAERINRDRRELAREARLNALRAPVAPAEWAF